MKKFFSLMLIFILTVSFSACTDKGSEKSAENAGLKLLIGEERISEWNGAYEMYVATVSYPVLKLDEECAGRYPELDKRLESINRDFEKENKKTYKELYDSGIDMLSDNPKYFNPFESSEDVIVRCVNEKIVSMLFQCYYYSGGAHPYQYYYGKTLDSRTGEEIELSDVVSDMNLLCKYAADELNENYEPEVFFSSPDEALPSLFEEKFDAWTLDNSGLTLYFSPYVLSSYAAGAQFVTLSGDEYPDLLNPKYLPDDEAFGIQLPGYVPFFYDIDSDGISDKISFREEYNYEAGLINDIKILVNDIEYDSGIGYAYEYTPTFIHTKNGDNLLYIETVRDDDYRATFCHNITPGKPQLIEEFKWGMRTTYEQKDDESDVCVFTEAFSNPENFAMSKRSSVLSSVTVSADFSVSRSMLPKSKDKIYRVDSDEKFEFTLLKNIKAQVYDEKTNKTSDSITLKKGDRVEYYAVDDKHHAYLRLEDSRIVCLEVNDSDWPRTVDGTDIEKIFEGIMFAG